MLKAPCRPGARRVLCVFVRIKRPSRLAFYCHVAGSLPGVGSGGGGGLSGTAGAGNTPGDLALNPTYVGAIDPKAPSANTVYFTGTKHNGETRVVRLAQKTLTVNSN